MNDHRGLETTTTRFQYALSNAQTHWLNVLRSYPASAPFVFDSPLFGPADGPWQLRVEMAKEQRTISIGLFVMQLDVTELRVHLVAVPTSSERVVGMWTRRVFKYELAVYPPKTAQSPPATRLREQNATVSSTSLSITFALSQQLATQHFHPDNSLHFSVEISTPQKVPRPAIQPESLPCQISSDMRAILFDDATADVLLELGLQVASAEAPRTCIRFTDTDGTTRSLLPAHKTILLARCPYFAALFRSGKGLDRTLDTGTGPRVVISASAYSHQAVSAMLEHLYCGVLETCALTSLAGQLELADTANYYQLPGLHAAATELIVKSNLVPETAIYILGTALVNSVVSDLLVRYARAFVQNHFDAVMETVVSKYAVQMVEHRQRLRTLVFEDVETFVGWVCQVMEEVDGAEMEAEMEMEDDVWGDGGGEGGATGSFLSSASLRGIANTSRAIHVRLNIVSALHDYLFPSSPNGSPAMSNVVQRSVRGLARLCVGPGGEE
ncbi:hypothetical protein HDV00_003738 [Rhizophlyctis rosea]|nr:hypothetical protein HDV00_003738 [Rhizophlyctis rosea]